MLAHPSLGRSYRGGHASGRTDRYSITQHERWHCSLPRAVKDNGLPEHFMWACPAAQRLWTALRDRWNTLRSAGQSSSDEDFQRSVFRLRLEVIPDRLWDHPEMRRLPTPTPAGTSATHQALQAIWRLQVMATFHTLWRWRTAATEPQDLWSEQLAMAYHEGGLRAVLANPRWPRARDSAASCHTAAMIEVLRQAEPGGNSNLQLQRRPPQHNTSSFSMEGHAATRDRAAAAQSS
jgi:hypothetical protein